MHETFRDEAPVERAFATTARQLCDKYGSLLILDDIRAGFRLARAGSWEELGVQPDLSTWGKCLANGYPISALLGSESARHGAGEMFVTGSFWYSATPMAAAIETLKHIRESDYLERTIEVGRTLRDGLQHQAASHGFTLKQSGPVQMPQILFDDDRDFRVGYAWVAEALKRGAYFHPYHNMFLSAAHTVDDVKKVLSITDDAFAAVKQRRAKLEPHPMVVQLLNLQG